MLPMVPLLAAGALEFQVGDVEALDGSRVEFQDVGNGFVDELDDVVKLMASVCGEDSKVVGIMGTSSSSGEAVWSAVTTTTTSLSGVGSALVTP